MHKANILLINPWIYDFAAFDMWTAPIGLLYIGGLLRENGYHIDLINCLDRYNPDLLVFQNREYPGSDEYGCGKFHKEIIEKPAALKDIPRRYGRYGLPLHIFQKELNKRTRPDVILVTSGMTYWYPGVFDAIKQTKMHFPDVPVVLGGTYATLCYDHAVQNSGADYVVKGEGEIKALNLVDEILGRGNLPTRSIPQNIDEYPYPAYDLLTNKNSLAILTSRGCPLSCTYCASRLVSGKFRQRNPIKVADEIEFHIRKFGTSNFIFFDDALLINPEKHISIVLDEVINRKLNCYFHTPNGMHAQQISKSLACQMAKAGFKTIRISLETSNAERQQCIGNKVTPEGLRHAIENLKSAGYEGRDIGVYVLIGLPGQPVDEMLESVKFVYNCGAMTKIAVYSPIPGTVEWEKSVEEFGLTPPARRSWCDAIAKAQSDAIAKAQSDAIAKAQSDAKPEHEDSRSTKDVDPLLHNDSIFPIRSGGMTIQSYQKVKAFALECNRNINV